jgi:hypothetical protein
VDAAARFYRKAFDAHLSSSEAVHVDLALEGELGFVVDDLAAAHARAVDAGARVAREPRDGLAAYLDPDGNVVTLTQRRPARRAAGADLARGALAVVVLEGTRVVDAFRCERFADALLVDAEIVGVDVPIGLRTRARAQPTRKHGASSANERRACSRRRSAKCSSRRRTPTRVASPRS